MADVKISQLPLTSTVCTNALVPIVQNGMTCSTYACNIGGLVFAVDSGCNSTVRTGVNNCASGSYSAAIGGFCNTASGCNSAVLGGQCNVASASFSGAFGCNLNACNGCTFYSNNFCACGSVFSSAISCGCGVCADANGQLVGYTPSVPTPSIIVLGTGCNSSVRCGVGNTAQGSFSAVLGGNCNNVCNCTSGCLATGAVVVGGVGNNTCGGTWSLASCAFTVAPTICDAGIYSFVGGGFQNKASGCNTFVGGGFQNTASEYFGSVVGGSENTATGCFSFIGGGCCNSMISTCAVGFAIDYCPVGSVIVGGSCNCIRQNTNGCFVNALGHHFIGGGCLNTAGRTLCGFETSSGSVVVGGLCNITSGSYSVTGGGFLNTTSGTESVTAGGVINITSGSGSFTGSGSNNTTSGSGSFTGSGCCNTTSGGRAVTVGGFVNTTNNNGAFTGGGACNTTSGYYSFTGGGFKNTNQAFGSFIGSGNCNNLCNSTSGCLAYGSVVVGGVGNNTCGGTWSLACCRFTSAPTICNAGLYSFVGGGFQNRAGGCNTFVGGGFQNSASECFGSVVGGSQNTATGCFSFIGGGCCNSMISTCVGGFAFTFCPLGSAIVGGSCNCIMQNIDGCFSFACGHHFIGGGSKNIAGKCACDAQTAGSIVVGGFCNIASGMNAFTGSGYCNISSGDCSVTVNGFSNTTSGSGSFTGSGSNNTTSGSGSFTGSGSQNTTSGQYAFTGGGRSNTTSGGFNFTGGGCRNTNQALGGSFIGSGNCNNLCNSTNPCFAYGSVVVGGVGNNTCGGTWNLASGFFTSAPTICDAGIYSAIGGGFQNRAGGACSFVGGGDCNVASGINSAILAGECNTASGSFSGAFGCNLNACNGCTFYSNNFCACGSVFTSAISCGCGVCADANGQLVGYTPSFINGGYGNFSQSGTLTATTQDTEYLVELNTTNTNSGVSLAGSPTTQVTFASAGTYRIMFSTVLLESSGGTAIVSLWFKKNGTNIANSNTDVNVPNNKETVVSVEWIENVTANQYIEIAWSSDTAGTQMASVGTQSTPTRPATPSIIVTTNRVA